MTAVLVGTVLAAATAAVAQQAPEAVARDARVVMSASAGVVRPGDGLARDLYGGAQLAFGLDCEVPVSGWLQFFVGGRLSTAQGSTSLQAPQAFDEAHDIELATRSLHAGGALVRRIGARLRVFAGAGLAAGWYEERWPALGEPVNGTTLGVVALGGVHYDLASRFGLVARTELSWLRAREEAGDGRNPNLGGLGFTAGASVRF